MSKARAIFEKIRDVPYSVIANEGEKPQHCLYKNSELIQELARLGYGVRGRVGEIDWHDLGLPDSLIKTHPKDIIPTHFYCEIFYENKWLVLDASWDPLMKAVGAVSEWGQENVSGFIIRKLYSIEEQTAFFDYWSDPVRGNDYLHRAASFLKGFDDWVIAQRVKAIT